MLSRFSVLVVYLVAGLAVSAVATPARSGDFDDDVFDTRQPSKHVSDRKHRVPKYYHFKEEKHSVSQCNVGKQYCCNSLQKVEQGQEGGLAALIGSVTSTISQQGTFSQGDCSPSLGSRAGTCRAQPVCCDNTQVNGLVALGCSNINVDL